MASNLSTLGQQVLNTRFPCCVFDTSADLSEQAAETVARVIRERNALGQQAVLGLPAGSTPVGVYRALIEQGERGLDFSNVVVFCLHEYHGVPSDQPQSLRHWMHVHLLDHVNIPPENVHFLDGKVPAAGIAEHCQQFEELITAAGGIDVMLLGIGTNGHIAFNEPFSIPNSRTRLCTLDPVTRTAAASDFYGEENVPGQALTMGLGTLLDARKIVLMAIGEHKASIIRETLEGAPTDRVPATVIQQHADATCLLDRTAAKELTSVVTPWVLGNVKWTDALIKRAVLWLCEQTGKALLKLDDDDFRDHNLHQLVRRHGPAQQLAHRVFRWMLNTIEYHPAGKDRKTTLCFSPHPDDDVISMGGTLIRLIEDGHRAHVAYMTSGNIAVFDHDARRVADLLTEFNRLFKIDQERSKEVESEVFSALKHKNAGENDSEAVLKIKGLIRWSEAKAAAIEVGCLEEDLHFLDLPFYRTGTISKRPIGPEDIKILRDLIEKVQPEQIYVAGDLADPHGTHRQCALAIFAALEGFILKNGDEPVVLLYRGAWQEYELHEIEIAIPLSPSDLALKRKAIFMHESQKDEALFPGSDPREFWQRAEDRNKGTANRYNQIGLPEFLALEAFVRWKGEGV